MNRLLELVATWPEAGARMAPASVAMEYAFDKREYLTAPLSYLRRGAARNSRQRSPALCARIHSVLTRVWPARFRIPFLSPKVICHG
ncbi:MULTISPECIES: hypothetical protein [Paraburkholderia]|uniref:hypothetical protein n=1 Tax=Paraburkholderia TaxID=1822464 RepID=UPI0013A689B7|nr:MULTISPECIES: hypothetical protein [Paraburkholderia]MDH6147592.1 hypothetical protein [Paraburkholderia sp. WSM4179]